MLYKQTFIFNLIKFTNKKVSKIPRQYPKSSAFAEILKQKNIKPEKQIPLGIRKIDGKTEQKNPNLLASCSLPHFTRKLKDNVKLKEVCVVVVNWFILEATTRVIL